MRASQIIGVQILVNGIWTDYSSGTLSVNIVRGVQEYKGPLSQPDVGQLQLISRNELLDPYNNPEIKYNAPIRINADGQRIYSGRIEGINVDYQPMGEPAIVTITGIDMIGVLHKFILSDSYLATYENTVPFIENLGSEIDGYTIFDVEFDGLDYAHGHSDPGTTALEGVIIRAKTDMGFFFTNARDEIEYYRRTRIDPLHPYNFRPTKLSFKSNGTGESYLGLSLSDGFEQIVNAIEVSGTGNSSVKVASNDSINLWGKSSATLELQTNNTTDMQTVANQVMTEMAEPFREIYQITWDATLNGPVARDIDIFDNIEIEHYINQTTTIDRKYSVIGIQHDIQGDNWIITYTLRNFDYQNISIPNPVIVATPPTGDTNTNFSITWVHPNPELFTTSTWDLDDGFTGNTRTVTVNYDTNGTKTINLTVMTIYGYTKEVSIPLEVAVGAPQAAFTYSVDDIRRYFFTYTGDSATTYLWNFGDGTTSSEQNPMKYYLTGGSRTVTLTASNSIGSTTVSQTIETLAIQRVPVRYVRLRYTGINNTPATFESSLTSNYAYASYTNFRIRKSDNSSISGWSVIDHDDYYGNLIERASFDSYTRQKPIPKNTLTTAMKTGEITPSRYTTMTLTSNTVVCSTIIDLGQEYFDIKDIMVDRFSNQDPAGGMVIRMDVSRDQGIWYAFGRIQSFTSGVNSVFTYENSSYQIPDYRLNAAPAIPDYYKIRYIRIRGNQITSDTARRYRFNEILILSGNGTVPYNKTYLFNGQNYPKPVDWVTGFGGIDTSRNHGAQISYPLSINSGTIQWRGPGTLQESAINPGTSFNNLNYKNTKDYVAWEETLAAKTLLIDLGEATTRVSGIHFDMRDQTGAITGGPSTSAYTITISWSEDGNNWTEMGTYTLAPVGATWTGGLTYTSSDGAPWKLGTTLNWAMINTDFLLPLTP